MAMKLVMTLRTRDQADIVDAVVAFHLNAGVDFVIATDHRSSDGTVEILREYVRAGVLRLLEEHGEEVRGQEWRTRMARMAAVEYGADWTFSCDGDEFWWPRAPTLKDAFAATPRGYGVISAVVRHFVGVAGTEPDFWERMTVRYSPEAAVHSPLTPYRPYQKVAHRADPAVVVHRGNHELRRTVHRVVPGWYPVEVLHFPVRTAEQARQKYLAWARVFGADARGTHAATARAERTGDADAHAATYLHDEHTVQRGVESGVLERDRRLCAALRSLVRPLDGMRRFALPRELDGCLPLASSPLVRDAQALVEAHTVRLARRLDGVSRRVRARESLG